MVRRRNEGRRIAGRAPIPPGDATRLIGSDPGERYSGGAAVTEFLRGEVQRGDWKFVQTHASIGVPNEEIGWVYPG